MSFALTASRCIGALAFSAVLLAGCNRQTPAQRRPTPAESGEERARIAVLDTIAARVATARLVLSGLTWAPGEPVTSVIVERARDQAGSREDTVEDFRARTAVQVALRAPRGTRAEIVIVPPADLAPGDGEDAETHWQRFREAHRPATGWVRITRAGFDQSRSSAMIAAKYRCGTRCGWGALYTLSRVADDWSIAEEAILWIQ